MTAAGKGTPRRSFRALAVVGAVLVSLVLGELAVRVDAGELASSYNFLLYPSETHHPQLGWVPANPETTPGAENGRLRTFISDGIEGYTHPGGIRDNGNPALPPRPLILATGDSYTWGDEVTDAETYPAHLERLLGYRVLNGGVPGYGLDQTVLRTEILAARFKPDLILVGLIPDDIGRCEDSYRHQTKPYFDIVDGRLDLRNTPVLRPDEVPLRLDQQVFGHSLLAHRLLLAVDFPGWNLMAKAHTRGPEVAALLIKRLDELVKRTGIPVVVVLQYWKDDQRSILAGLKAAKPQLIRFVDLFPPPEQREAWAELYLQAHLNSEGNRRQAVRVREYLVQTGLLPASRPR